eukprot:gene19125-21042_t
MIEQRNLYQIFVNTSTKVLCLRNIQPELQVIQLKSIVELRTGIPAEQQDLLLSGTILSDNSRIAEAGLRDRHVVRLVLKSKEINSILDMVLRGDLAGILNTGGVQMIDLTEANDNEERQRLVKWNNIAMQRAFIAVTVACTQGMLELVVSLLKLSAFSVNQVTGCGRSALHFAAARGSVGCVCVLLDNNIDPRIQDNDGKTAQDLAADNGHNESHLPNVIQLKTRSLHQNSGEDCKLQALDDRGNYSSAAIDRNETHTDGHINEASVHDINVERTEKSERGTQTFIGDKTERNELATMFYLVDKYGYIVSDGNFLQGKDSSFGGDKSWKINMRRNRRSNYVMQTKMDTRQIGPGLNHPGTKLEEKAGEREDFAKEMSNERNNDQQKSKEKDEESIDEFREKVIGQSGEKSECEKKMQVQLIDPMQQERLKIETGQANGQSLQTTDGRQLNAEAQEISQVGDDGKSGCSTTLIVEDAGLDSAASRDGGGNAVDIKRLIGRVVIGNSGRRDGNGDARTSFEQWLERKSREKRERVTEGNSAEQSEKKREINEQAFKKWLELKKASYSKTKSASGYRPGSVDKNSNYNNSNDNRSLRSSGMSFESWMTKKNQDKPRSRSLPAATTSVSTTHAVINRSYSSGRSYEEWIKTKRKSEILQEKQNDSANGNEVNKRTSGLTFETWIATKKELSQIERVREATESMQREYQKKMKYEKKLKDPRIKTFEEWEIEKKYEQRLQKTKQKKDRRLYENGKVKYEEDAKLVYSMWLMDKHLREIEFEEEQREKARKEWEKKMKNKKSLKRANTR